MKGEKIKEFKNIYSSTFGNTFSDIHFLQDWYGFCNVPINSEDLEKLKKIKYKINNLIHKVLKEFINEETDDLERNVKYIYNIINVINYYLNWFQCVYKNNKTLYREKN